MKNEIQEGVWEKHDFLMKKRCKKGRPWAAKTELPYDTCHKIDGFGMS